MDSSDDEIANPKNGHLQDQMESVVQVNSSHDFKDQTAENMLNKKTKPIKKNWSFGTTNWENSLRFTAGEIEGERRMSSSNDDLQSETSPLIKIDKADKSDIEGASAFKTFINIVKSFVGTGILMMGSAYQNGGIVFSTILLTLLALLTLVCMLLLVSCWEKHKVSFGEIAEIAFGKAGKFMVDGTLVVAQLSFGCVYMVFVGEHIIELVFPTNGTVTDPAGFTLGSSSHYSPPEYSLSGLVKNEKGEEWLWAAILIQIPLLTPLVWIRRVYRLSIVNFFGTMCIIFGIVWITISSSQTLATEGKGENIKIWVNNDFLLFVGTAIFTFEGIGTVIPIQQSMKEKHKFKGLLTAAILTILGVLVFFATICYMTYGDQIRGPVTLNLPSDAIMTKIVLGVYAVAIFFSYPLIVFPAVEILSKLLFDPTKPVTRARTWKKNFFRFLLVCLTAGIGIGGGDDFENFVSLIGGFACTPLGFVFPALFHYKLVATTKTERIFDIFLMIVGTGLGIFATGYAILSWVQGARPEPTQPPTAPPGY